MTGVMAIDSTHPSDVRLFTSISGNHYINLCEIRKTPAFKIKNKTVESTFLNITGMNNVHEVSVIININGATPPTPGPDPVDPNNPNSGKSTGLLAKVGMWTLVIFVSVFVIMVVLLLVRR